jgi:RNA ligase
MDGSLGILYRENEAYRIATRGSFDSDQAIWATDFLSREFNLWKLPPSITLLFEIIYPDNRIVIDYQGKEDIVLLAARNRINGRYLPWWETRKIAELFHFSLPKVFEFLTVNQILKARQEIDINSEGWVVEFEDGQRFKFKGVEYLKVHKLIAHLSFKNTLTHITEGNLNNLYDIIPDEFLDEVKGWAEEINNTIIETEAQVKGIFNLAPKETRKVFAIWVMENHQAIAPYLFAMLDNKPIKPLIYKHAFKDRL